MIRIFLAHASEDKKAVTNLYNRLKQNGYQPWLDEIDLLPGQNWTSEIPKAIQDSDVFIACLSSISIAKEGYVQREFKMAMQKMGEIPPGRIYLIPLRLDECQIPALRQEEYGINLVDYQWVDLFASDGFERLVKSLETRSGNVLNNSNSTTSYRPDEFSSATITAVKQRVEKSLMEAKLDLDRKRQGYHVEENRADGGQTEGYLVVGSALAATTLGIVLTGGLGVLAGPAIIAGWETRKRSKKLIRYAPISANEHEKAKFSLNDIEKLLQNGYVSEAEAKMQQYKAPVCQRS